ncbi:hypothetical protein M2444_000265 [Paenibacillus sp. PastF-3]|nr:hypothetical protein [Paenibacillus sp. PastF-3]
MKKQEGGVNVKKQETWNKRGVIRQILKTARNLYPPKCMF